MPDKLTDNEIVKACENCFHLEVCLKNLTNAFPDTSQEEINLVLMLGGHCKNFIDKDLINRLKAENEDYKALYEGLKAEHIETIKAIKHYKSEAYEEFAERLKERKYLDETGWSHGEHPYIVEEDDIDDVLEKLAGD